LRFAKELDDDSSIILLLLLDLLEDLNAMLEITTADGRTLLELE